MCINPKAPICEAEVSISGRTSEERGVSSESFWRRDIEIMSDKDSIYRSVKTLSYKCLSELLM